MAAPVMLATAGYTGELPAVMVLNIKHEEQAGQGLSTILTELVLQEIHDTKRVRVVGRKDIDQMLSQEQQKQLAGCTDTSCLVEIAGALGTRYTVDGTVGIIGDTNVLSLSLVDTQRAAVISRKTTVVKGDKAQLIESVQRMVKALIEPILAPGEQPGARKPGAQPTSQASGPQAPRGAGGGQGVGILYVEGSPKGATLIVEGPPTYGSHGQVYAKIPYGPVEVYAGEYKVRAAAPVFETQEIKVAVVADQLQRVKIDLNASRTAAPAAPPPPPPSVAPPDREPKTETVNTTVEHPMNPYRASGHACIWGGVGVVGLGGVFTALASSAADDFNSGVGTSAAKSDISTFNALAVTGYVIGGAAIVTGAILWYLDPGDEAWAIEHKISLMPAVDQGQIGLAARGVW